MRLKELRKRDNLTQRQLAKIVGYEQTIISMWENGTREPGNETLIKMADYFNVTVDFLLGRDFEEKKEPEILQVQEELSEEQIECIELIKQLNERDVLKLLGYAENLKTQESERKAKKD